MPMMSLTAYARSRQERGLSGGTRAAVKKAIAQGRIKTLAGKVNQETADAAWGDNTLPVETFSDARARKEAAQADLAEMQAAAMRGRLLDADATEHQWCDVMGRFRARVLVIPSMLAPQIAQPGRVSEVESLIRKALYEALAELSGGSTRSH
jgi:phage terminase Nu1 subunit (DNA packaging protein)